MLCAVSCRSPKQPEPRKLQPFEFLIDWQAEPTYLGIYYAKRLGEFEKLGLDVSIIQSWGANQAVIAVATGRYKIATASGGATVLGYNNGEEIVSLAVLYPKIPSVIYGLASTNVLGPRDLEGKRIGIYPGSITKNEFDAFVRANKLDARKMDIVSLNGSDIPLLLTHRVDAVLQYAEMSPIEVNVNPSVRPSQPGQPKLFELWLARYGVAGYGLNIVTSRQSFLRDGKLLQQVADAAVRGYQLGCADKESAVKAFLSDFPQKNPDYVRESWKRVCEMVGNNYGTQSLQGWQQTIDLYQSLGLLKHRVDAKSVLP
jgi:NitT/TauT family transport system substrate-binding protein